MGGRFGGVNYLEFPRALTGVDARVLALVGKWFSYRCAQGRRGVRLSRPRLVTGQFDPTTQKAVWPSTGQLLSRRRVRLGAARL